MPTKELINIPGLDANKTLSMLENDFPLPLEIDRKDRLVVSGKVVKVFIKFKQIGQSTEIKFAGSKWISVAKVMFIPFYWMYAYIQALDEHTSLVKEVANALRHRKAPNSSEDISIKIAKLKHMKEQGIISEEEFYTKKAELIEQL